MKKALLYLWSRRTTAFGYIVISLGVIASSDGVFSVQTMKYILLVNGLLTACLGHYNNRKQNASPPQP